MNRFEAAGAAFADLVALMARLRGPNGCPWDQKQTLQTLKPYLLEETHEVLEAMDGASLEPLCGELGDLLLQIVFQAELAFESGDFDAAAVAQGIHQKMVRRHPHVFAPEQGESGAGIENWEALKAKERGAQESCLDGIPKALPALLKAHRTGEKAAASGFDWPKGDEKGPRSKVDEEWGEVRDAIQEHAANPNPQNHAAIKDEVGDLLFALCNVARRLDIDPEDALQQATHKFSRRFRHIESALKKEDKRPKDVDFDRLNTLWDAAKQAT